MNAYVIAELGWEYNDEHFYQTESPGGTPIKAFLSKEKAKASLDEHTKKLVMDLLGSQGSHWSFFGLNNGCNEVGDPLSDDSIKFLEERGLSLDMGDDYWDHQEESQKKIKALLETLSDEEIYKFCGTLTVAYYEIAEVKLDDETVSARC